jgi:aquaporin Z
VPDRASLPAAARTEALGVATAGARTRGLPAHLPEYLIEAWGIGAFMLSAIGFTVLLEHAASPVRAALPDAAVRRGLMGLAMAGTALGLVYSPWGKRSGAHFNPAMTFTWWRLGKIETRDALAYGAAQLAGAVGGALVAGALLLGAPAHASVRFAVTLPGDAGLAAAFAAEAAISALLMFTVLTVSNRPGLNRFTGIFAACLIATYIALEAPISGMSMNPARTLGSAAGARVFDSLWLYFTAPPLGMLAAAELYVRTRGARAVLCAKLHHENRARCIFRCAWPGMEA